MNIAEIFIKRPVMTTLVMIAILLFGAMAYRNLPVSDLPNVDFPTIQVSASLPGATPETMASAVAMPLEKQFSTIAGVDSMTSTSTQGNTQVTLQFNLSRSLDAAAQDVQSMIAKAARDLLARPATLHLIHVRPTLRTAVADIEGWDEIYDAGVTAKLDKLARDVSGNGVIAYGRIVSGKIAESLLRIAGDVRAGLIACGTDSLNTLERLILGRIPAQLLRGAECSVLVAPCARTLETQEESR